MTWGAVAVSGATLVASGVSAYSASQDREVAREAADAALAFEEERYQDWKDVYGPLQDNLADYYSKVTPDYYAATGLEAFEQQYQTGLKRLDEDFAQRGIDPSSGIRASLGAQAELGAAETRAGIRREAPRQAAEDKMRFLQVGLGQNPAQSVSNTLAQQSQNAQVQSQNSDIAAGNALSTAIPTIGTAIDAYNKPAVKTSGSSSYSTYTPNAGAE